MNELRRMTSLGARSLPAGDRTLTLAGAVALATLLASCAQTGPVLPAPAAPAASTPPANVEPPAPGINLSGFPLTYRQGYADGCASAGGAARKDASRFAADGNYRTGWQDGLALCRKR
jgi:hypothetical protein